MNAFTTRAAAVAFAIASTLSTLTFIDSLALDRHAATAQAAAASAAKTAALKAAAPKI